MKLTQKSRFRGINNLPAYYYYFPKNGKKDRSWGIQKMEIWFAKINPSLEESDPYLGANKIEILIFGFLLNPFRRLFSWWLSLNTDQKIRIVLGTIGIIIAAIKF